MKRIYLLLLLLTVGLVDAQAQRMIDLMTTMNKPAANTPVAIGVDFPVEVIYTNKGPAKINAGDTLKYLYTGHGLQSGQYYFRVITTAKNVNDTIQFKANFSFSTATNGNLNFCFAAIIDSGAAIGADPDTTNNSSCKNIVISGGTWPASIPEVKEVADKIGAEVLTFSPNPATGMITLNYTAGTTSELKARVIDITGREVLATSFGKTHVGQTGFRMDVSNLTQGIYFVELSQDNYRSKGKLMKQ
jgi:hypothetical protein